MTTLSGPASVTPGATNTYTLVVSGGPAVEAGMDVSANGGTLTATMAGTKMSGADVVHSAPRAVSSGSASFTFSWTAPASNGTYTIYAAGLSSNNGNNDSGDGTARTTLTVSVTGVGTPSDPNAPPPADPPSASPGETLFNDLCSGCHGDGGSGGSIAGESAEDIHEAFAEYSIHDEVAAALTDDDIAAIADYLNDDTEPVPGDPTAGQELFDANCSGCHSSGGAGGSIAGESADDIHEAFAEYPVHEGLAAILSDTDIAAIAAYLAAANTDSDDDDDEQDLVGPGDTGNGGNNNGRQPRAKASSAAGTFDLIALMIIGGYAAIRRGRNRR